LDNNKIEKPASEIKLSVVVPFFNEEENAGRLVDRLLPVLSEIGGRYEIIAVDDGSVDETVSKLREKKQDVPELKIVKLRRNFGQTQAMQAGIDQAAGEIIVTMDGDLQNDPSDIPLFIQKITEGYDIVCGWRHKRKDKLISRKIPSKIANWIIGKITGVPIKDNGCSLKAYRAEVIRAVSLYSDMHRFIPAMASMAGTKVTEIKVKHHARQFGVSKYGISRTYKVIVDLMSIKMILSFSSHPLRLFAYLALGGILLGGSILIYGFSSYLSQGRFDLMMTSSGLLFFVMAMFLLSVGVLCELVIKTGNFRSLANVKMRVE